MLAVPRWVRLQTIHCPSGDQLGFCAPAPDGSDSGMSWGSLPSGCTIVSTPYGRWYTIHCPSGDHPWSMNAPPHGVMRRRFDPSASTVKIAPAPCGLTPVLVRKNATRLPSGEKIGSPTVSPGRLSLTVRSPPPSDDRT